MLFFYNAGIWLYSLLIAIVSVKNKKAKLWIEGRKGLLDLIEKSLDRKKSYSWFHFASLGEFEQGRPVIEKLKQDHPHEAIVITFFSPSGYEIRKSYPLANHVFYLPIDTKINARRFISILKPKIAVFTKYEYWYHYFEALHENNTPLFIISGIFRKEQAFFKWYGGLHRKMLNRVSHLFVQNEESKELLSKIGINRVTVSGDTRFDRVAENAKKPRAIENIKIFCEKDPVFIAGSTWSDDELLIASLVSLYPSWKFIIASHEVNEERINQIKRQFPNSLKLSEIEENKIDSNTLINTQVLIIDSIGILSSVYQYGKIAYIGGGFGVGIHNTLEAAAFGLPVLFGPNYARFKEAVDLISLGAAFSIHNSSELKIQMKFLSQDEKCMDSGKKALDYVKNHTGATQKFLNYVYRLKIF